MASLYLKYRPKELAELDIDSVRETLEKTFKSGKPPHAFLFAGPKGTGKTSAARIVAKIVNCETRRSNSIVPCNKCPQCQSIGNDANVDVIELDAASHRGIDDVRALKGSVKLAPASARKKVYIIDEAHMLTTEAANALLKTLEEPPDHVMFILATTNPERLLETVRSRATLVNFRKAKRNEVKRQLARIVKGEKIKAAEEVLELVAEAAEGDFRASAKLLEGLMFEKVDLKNKEKIKEYLKKSESFSVSRFMKCLKERDEKGGLVEIERLISLGVTAEFLAESLFSFLHEELLSRSNLFEGRETLFEKKETVDLIDLFTEAAAKIPVSPIDQLPLEAAVVVWCSLSQANGIEEGNGSENEKEEEEEKEKVKSEAAQSESQEGSQEKRITLGKESVISEEVWHQVLLQVRAKNASTEALLRAARPAEFDGRILRLGVFYRFHKEHLETNPHRSLLETELASVLGSTVKVVLSLATQPQVERKVEEEVKEPLVLAETKDDDIVRVAKEIFGS